MANLGAHVATQTNGTKGDKRRQKVRRRSMGCMQASLETVVREEVPNRMHYNTSTVAHDPTNTQYLFSLVKPQDKDAVLEMSKMIFMHTSWTLVISLSRIITFHNVNFSFSSSSYFTLTRNCLPLEALPCSRRALS